MKKNCHLLISVFVLGIFSLHAQIPNEVISLNFNSNAYSPLDFEEAGVVKASHWVKVNGSSGESGRPTQIKNNYGYPTTARLFYNLNNKVGSTEPVDLSSPDQCMLSGVAYFDKRDNSLDFKYIPESFTKYGYDVYMYWNKHESEPTTVKFKKGGVTYFLYQETSQNYKYIRSFATTEDVAKTNPNANYVVFENNTENYPKYTAGRISGMQIVSHKGMKPQALYESNMNNEGFSFGWAKIDNAETYGLECYKVLFFEDFVNFESFDANTFSNAENASTSVNEEKFNSLTRQTGWSLNSANIYNAGGYFRMGSGNSHASFTTPSFAIKDATEYVELDIELKFDEGSKTELSVELLDEDGAVQHNYSIAPEYETGWKSEWLRHTIPFSDIKAGEYRLRLSGTSDKSGQNRFWLDNIIVSTKKVEDEVTSNFVNISMPIESNDMILCRVKANSSTMNSDYSNHFFVVSGDVPTGLEKNSESDFKLLIEKSAVKVIQYKENPDPVIVLDIYGRQVYFSADTHNQRIDLHPGFYVICVGNQTEKVMVR